MLCGLKCGKRCKEGTYLDVISMDKLIHEDGDDTRGGGDTICPPEDKQRAARNMLRIVV
jgi:hypothetical protein